MSCCKVRPNFRARANLIFRTFPSTEDWSIGEAGGATLTGVHASLTKWLTGPKSPGLIILEHELTNDTVSAFIDAFPMIKQNGWNIVSVAELDGNSAYFNADGDTGTVSPATLLQYAGSDPSSIIDNGAPASPSPTAAGSNSSAPSGGKTGSVPATVSGNSTGATGAPGSSPTGAAQQKTNSASSLLALVDNVPAALAAVSALLFSAVALA